MNPRNFWSFLSQNSKGTPISYGNDKNSNRKHLSVIYNANAQAIILRPESLQPVPEFGSKSAFLSIIIIAYNEEKFLPSLLASLEVQSFKNFEIIIVDSNSTDNTTKAYRQFRNSFNEIRLLQLGCTKGPAYARNQGALQAKYKQLVFLDADTLLKNDFLQRVVNEIKTRGTDVASCRIRIAENGFTSNLGAYFLNMFMVVLKPIYTSAYGACLISTKNIHEQIGGFREDLAICEDCNYMKQARMIGAKFNILSPYFYTSDRRAKTEGSTSLLLKYFRIHLSRMIFRKEIINGEIKYNYGNF